MVPLKMMFKQVFHGKKNISFPQERTTIYIILLHKVDIQSKTEVEFSSDSIAPQHVPATVLNEYTISVTAPGRYPSKLL